MYANTKNWKNFNIILAKKDFDENVVRFSFWDLSTHAHD